MFKTFLCSISILLFLSVKSQTLVSALNTYNSEQIHEKIHVHFDKSVYSPGETIWYKAYLMASGFPSNQSTNFYTEILNEKGELLQRKISPVFLSSSSGSIDIPLNLPHQRLIFRAYTLWMLNSDTTFIYRKTLLLNPSVAAIKAPAKSTKLNFYPEGGDWVERIESYLAFKASDQYGMPIEVSGHIKDANGKVIKEFKTIHNGMGRVLLQPGSGYYAEWNGPDGSTGRTDLPAAKKSGAIIRVNQTDAGVGYSLHISDDLPHLRTLRVIAQMHQSIAYRANLKFENKTSRTGLVPDSALITGVLRITVFDADWKPLAERVCFVNKKDYGFEANLNWLEKNLQKRGKNVFEIEVPDSLSSNLSVSVTDALLNDGADDDIISRLLLTSELRGYVHNPNFYFSNDADSTKEYLDLVMLTNGWRKYDWELLAKGEMPVMKNSKDNYLNLAGNIYGMKAGTISPQSQLNIILKSKDSSLQFLFAPVDQNGHFDLQGYVFFDTVTLYYQFNRDKKLNRTATVRFKDSYAKNIVIGTDSVFGNVFRNALDRSSFFTEKIAESFKLKSKMLETVIIKTRSRSREDEMEEKYTSGFFQTQNSRNYIILDDPFAAAYANALQYLQAKVPGLNITMQDGEYFIERRRETTSLFVNEFQATMDYFSQIPMGDIAYIKVFDPPFMGSAGNGGGGAIVIYTKKGGESNASNFGDMEITTMAGYTPFKQFSSPDYATSSPLQDLEDVRATLYWKPYVLTDKNTRKIRLEFYNNDVSASLRVVVEGMNQYGQLVHIEKIIH